MIRMPYQRDGLKTPITLPAVMSKSRDYNMIEYLMHQVFDFFYDESVESKNVHNPYRCDTKLLPLLADFYRYSYSTVDYTTDAILNNDMEREIISSVPYLHHNKGSSTGIDNALALSIINKADGVVIPWFYDKPKNLVTVIILDGVETYKMMELLKLVIPIGTRVTCKPGFLIKSSEEVQIHSWVEIKNPYLDPDKQWYVQPNNTWMADWDRENQLWHVFVQERADLDTARYGAIEVTNVESVENAIDEVNANTDLHLFPTHESEKKDGE